MCRANIPDIGKKIPLMFRAQTKGRSQLQFIDSKSEEQDSEKWVNEWIERAEEKPPQFGQEVMTKEYQISWRFVTNGGQDEGIIRPVMGAYGIPFYPGSSMKGAFCEACSPEQQQRYHLEKDSEQPSLLRFHGGYPVNDWTENLLDIVHPQQGWQVKTQNTRQKPGGESGFALISLYQPILKFGISSLLAQPDWDEIWSIWEKALESGLGCRVSSGYGLPKDNFASKDPLYKCFLKGQGMAPKSLDGEKEFRPNIFRGAIRGHALRIFGGLTDAGNAEKLVNQLFGGIDGEGTQGLLAVDFRVNSLKLGTFDKGYDEPTYDVTGELHWILTQSLPENQQECLKKLIRVLTHFAMLLGGFGKSWRRADHSLFYEDYYKKKKPLIGCHWQWDKSFLVNDNKVRDLNHVHPFIKEVRTIAKEWMNLRSITPTPDNSADWRESWHPIKVEVWGRIAGDRDDSLAIKWLHEAYDKIHQLSIKKTSITGSINKTDSQIGRLWHRMYPNNNHQYLELLTIFPDDSEDCEYFLGFLDENNGKEGKFQKLWPR
jgi:CRISPR-associated protein Cmr6